MLQYFTEKTNIGKIISELTEYNKKEYTKIDYNTEYEPDNKENNPFFSIITRTQGKRLFELREVFLCLAAQINTDFEVILIGHKIDTSKKNEIVNIINQQDSWLRKKITFVSLAHGNRTTPLNLGFSLARGKYISILDDDDIIFSNWVNEFYKSSLINNGTILHAYSATQEWLKIENGPYQNCVKSNKLPDPKYCKPYEWITQFNLNHCPPISLSFPEYIFHYYNIKFDETLTTTEDWDFLLRTSIFTGVSDIEIVTSIYREWKNAETSLTVHSEAEWKENWQKIESKILNSYCIISVKEIKNYNHQYKVFINKIRNIKIIILIWKKIKKYLPSLADFIKKIISRF